MKDFRILAIAILGSLATNVSAQWDAPVGIPQPAFGINESHTMYAGQSGYMDAGNGPYTHYVDNTSSSCSDSGNGTESQPRCSIPTSMPAGAVVEVHGGPYTVNGRLYYTLNGTQSAPVFLRGIDTGSGRPVFNNDDRMDFGGQYFVVEGINFQGTYLRVTGGGSSPTAGAANAALRDLQVANGPEKNAILLWGNNILLANSEIDHNQGDDRHGTVLGESSRDIWIVDNYYHHNGGDAIQFCHGCQGSEPRRVYIGRNVMHSDRENAVDLKYAQDVVVSQNTMYAYRAAPPNQNWCFDDGSGCGVFSSGSDGAAVVIGSDGGPTNVWFLLNDIYDAMAGIRVEEGYEVYLIGNRIRDISGETGRAIGLDKDGQPLIIVHNVISDAGYGIDQNWRENFTLTIHNNIFNNISSAHIRFESNSVINSASIDNNLFWQNGNPIPLVWNNPVSVSSSAQMDNQTNGSGNLVADPGFLSAASGNFRLASGSPAIDAGSTQLEQLDTLFQQRFPGAGSILFDADEATRPADGDGQNGAEYDIGAFETNGAPQPNPPTNLVVD